VTKNFKDLEYDIKDMLLGNHAMESMELRSDTARNAITLAKSIAHHTLDMVNPKPYGVKSGLDRSIRMSELGEPCLRKLLMKWYSPEKGSPPYAESPNAFLPVKFTYGDYIEDLFLFLAAEAGHSVGHRQHVVDARFPGTDWYLQGHMDCMIDGVVVDVKSSADVSFGKYKREGLTTDNDTFGYLYQIDGYSYSMGTDDRAIVFVNKHDGEIYVADRCGEKFLDIEKRVNSIASAADWWGHTGDLPLQLDPKVTKYGSQLPTVCSYCSFKYSCYNGDITGIIASSRPQYFVSKTITSEGYAYIKDKAKIAKPKAWAAA
jgi:hypothetical protein